MKTWAKIHQGVYMVWLLFTATVVVLNMSTYDTNSLAILALLVLILEGEAFLAYIHLTKAIDSFYYKGATVLNFFGLVGLAAIPMLGTPTTVSKVVHIGLLLGCVLCVQRMELLIKQIRKERRSY